MKLNKIDYESILMSNKLLQIHPLFFNLMCMSEIRVRHQCLVSAVGGRGGLMPKADFAFIERSWVRALARCFCHALGQDTFLPKCLSLPRLTVKVNEMSNLAMAEAGEAVGSCSS